MFKDLVINTSKVNNGNIDGDLTQDVCNLKLAINASQQ